MLGKRLIKSNDAGGGGCTNTVDLYNPFPDGGGVALYQLNGDATDVSGNYDGTASNVTYGAGQFGQAGIFNGSTSDIINTDLDVSTSTGFSISLWLNSNLNGSWQRPIQFGSGQNALTIQKRGDNNNFRVIAEISGTPYIDLNSTAIGTNVWIHYVVTFSGSSCVIYKNGSSATSISYSGGITHSDLYIGRRDTGTERFNGSIDQVRIFNRALRPYEVEALYTEEYCTPTIVPSEHFNTVLYSGNSGTQSITSVGFAPDLTWIKERTGTDHHRLQDTVRGAGYRLYSSTTSAEGYTNDSITSFDANGFSLGSSLGVNESGQNYVAWNFKAGGAAVTNTDGTITSQVSANTEAGFSVVSYTGNGANGTVGHGLGVTPNIVLTKRRDSTSNWSFNGNIGGLIYGTNKLALNDTAGIGADTNEVLAANSNNFTAGTSGSVGASGGTYVAYCFAEVEGFSNFGSYVGNGSTSGPTVITGFEPAFIMVKCSSSTGDWVMLDNKRTIENPRNKALWANLSNAEATGYSTDFLENGFQIKDNGSALNASGSSYIYMAFAADPTAVEPTLEDSFNTVTYTGNGGTNAITGVGFQPDWVWLKNRSTTQSHHLIDSVRGTTFSLNSNQTAAEVNRGSEFSSFDSDGFTLGSGGNMNNNGNNYVSWNWKGAEIPAINSNGSIPSVVSANPAAGFSIVSYKGNSIIGSTVGHGLNVAPDVVIYKGRQEGLPQYFANWGVYHSSLGATQRLWMNNDGAAQTAGGGDWINNTEPTDSVFTVGEYYTNWTGRDFIAYCFAEVAGFSKFGSYVGNGSYSGPTIDCGFEPAFVMIKATSDTGLWVMHDNKRGNYNDGDIYARLQAESSAAEVDDYPTATNKRIVLSPTGFQVTNVSNSWNGSGRTYIYMAFANQF